MGSPRFSVVIPTYQRRELVVEAVQALDRQHYDGRYEVVVVVDGSTDGSAAALRALGTKVSMRVIEQSNRGAASARNRGAGEAAGEILLFLDDDMDADPRLIAEHDRLHRAASDVVVGHMPLHPDSRGFLSVAVGMWSEDRLRRLSAPGAPLDFGEILTGQISIRRSLFDELGGFDESFTVGGTYGDEDVDFAARIMASGARVTFSPDAVSRQRYVVTPEQHLRQWRETGRADVAFARKHPARGRELFRERGTARRSFRLLWGPIAAAPAVGRALSALLRRPVLGAVRDKPFSLRRFRAYRVVQRLEYWRGVGEAGGVPQRHALTVLSYHAIADLADDPLLRPYAVPADAFERQLVALRRAGYRFVSAGEALRFLGGGGLPRRPLLLTFDDCYADLLTTAQPILRRLGVPALAFAVSSLVGATNRWDEALGARTLPLLDAGGLRALAADGVEIGAHSRTHPILVGLPPARLQEEVRGALDELASLGLPRPRFFAYPYGEHNTRTRDAVRAAGCAAAFTAAPGRVSPAGADRWRLPRIEVLRGDDGWRLLLKVAAAGSQRQRVSAARLVRHVARSSMRTARRSPTSMK